MDEERYAGLETPCFIFDEVLFEKNVEGFREELKKRFGNVRIGYSVKTNSLPSVLRAALRLGCMAEVVSHDEYELARLCGFMPERIIYNGPMKSRETFLDAVEGGAIVNIETKRELDWLASLPADGMYNIGLRLNINLSQISAKDADKPDDNSRFGFSDEAGEFAEALRRIESLPNVRLAGLHIHRTTRYREPRFYRRSVEFAVALIEKYGMRPDYIDIGGGFFGKTPGKPTFSDYTEAIYGVLRSRGHERVNLIVEPGRAVVDNAFRFLTEVIDVKRVDNRTVFATVDGSRNDIDPLFRKGNYQTRILYKKPGRAIEPLQIIAGCSCLEYDRIFSLNDEPGLEHGDRILFDNVGAYTMTLSPQFIRLFPRVYTSGADGTLSLLRRASTPADILLADENPDTTGLI